MSKLSIKDLFRDLLNETKGFKYQISGWIVELIESQHTNVSTYIPLSGSSCIRLTVKLRSSKKGLIKIKNNDQKCFLWCHIRHINPIITHSKRIT